METEHIFLDEILSIESDEQLMQRLASAIELKSCKKDPAGSRFYYLRPLEEKDIRPIAVGLFDELQGNDKQALKAKLTDRKDALYQEIYSHYLNRHLDEQPALYILLPNGHKRGLMTLIKPTDSGLKVRDQLLLQTDEREATIKLNLLRTKCPPLPGALVSTPNIDHLFYDPVDTAEELAKELAQLTRKLEQVIVGLYEQEKKLNPKGFLQELHNSFKAELLPHLKLTSDDPKEYGFADLYAQTISYGMFTGRCFKPTQTFERRYVSKWNIPPTNPFLKNLFESISDATQEAQQQYASMFEIIEDLVGCLSSTDMEAILADFSYDKTNHEDMVIHFYETFLQAYNQEQRELRGVYYTPYPVVSYIVRSVDLILKEKFNKPLGLADPEVLILDPATGTGTFLFAIFKHLEEFYKTQVDKTCALSWDEFVDIDVLPRLFGFELMMAPYAVAHLRLGVELQTSHYSFSSGNRINVFLTNTMEESAKKSDTLFEEFISNESDQAASIKRDKPIMVVVGNPPYSGHSANSGKWIKDLVFDYRKNCPELSRPAQAKWLQDDYVKFIRFGQWRIDRTGHGVLAFITNHGYLDNPTFRGMRESLLSSFDEIFIVDLHGNTKKKEKSSDGQTDENVFDIQQGVAIALCIKKQETPAEKKECVVKHWDLLGARPKSNKVDIEGTKYHWLLSNDINSTDWQSLQPVASSYLFVPQNTEHKSEYEAGDYIPEIFNGDGRQTPAPGIVTTHDEFAISFDVEDVRNKITSFINTDNETEARKLFRLCTQSQWSYSEAKKALKMSKYEEDICPILYRPFDNRVTVYNSHVAVHRRERVSKHLLNRDNIGLCLPKGTEIKKGWEHVFCSDKIIQHHTVSIKEVNYIFPLYLYPEQGNLLDVNRKGKKANINPKVINKLSKSLGLDWLEEGKGDCATTFGPEDLFYYTYAIFHSLSYRERFLEFLKHDFPRIPLTSDKLLFCGLSSLGEKLTQSHLLKSSLTLDAEFPQRGSNRVEQVTYASNQQQVWINKAQYFESVPEVVWDFHIGGSRVCEKWLKDRKKAGRSLSEEDVLHYRKIVAALQETIRLMAQIDEVIEDHGGWPIQ